MDVQGTISRVPSTWFCRTSYISKCSMCLCVLEDTRVCTWTSFLIFIHLNNIIMLQTSIFSNQLCFIGVFSFTFDSDFQAFHLFKVFNHLISNELLVLSSHNSLAQLSHVKSEGSLFGWP